MASDVDLETALLGPLVAGRSCGDCIACCRVLRIDTPDFAKPAETLCVHNDGQGCAIHATHPAVCRDWYCAWRRIAAMPEAARPDRSQLLVSLDINRSPRNCLEGVSIVVRALDDGTALDGAAADAILDVLETRLVPVWFSDGARKTLVHPPAKIADPVLSGAAPPHALRDEVQAWRVRYDVFR